MLGTQKIRHLPRQRVQLLEEAFANDIDDRRFIPHIQLHEFEAILFVDPSAFGTFYADCADQVVALNTIAQTHQSPEDIDDGLQTAPSKRIIDQFPDYEGAKRTAGPQIAARIGGFNSRKVLALRCLVNKAGKARDRRAAAELNHPLPNPDGTTNAGLSVIEPVVRES